ncbi:cysteine desulfurase family protein [Alsobacter sp. R-9]
MAGAARTYLDHNATTPLRPQARDAMLAAFAHVGNPSSVHAEGRAARALVEAAREQVAALAGTRPADIVFTSGGTEAAATALSPHVEAGGNRRPFDRLLVGATEHACVLAGGRFAPERLERLAVTADGLVDLGRLDERLREMTAAGERPMVALQAANNETGVVQPVARAAEAVHAAGGVLVCDAVQAAGKLDLREVVEGADIVLLSAHKIGGPQGVGAVAIRSCDVRLGRPLLAGGGQERGARAGTEAVALIAGFGAAAAAVRAEGEAERLRIRELRDDLEARCRTLAPDVAVFGADAPRLPNTVLLAIPGLAAETALIGFDLDGIAVSSGSACSSGKVRRSHVLDAMGVDAALAQGAIRVSLGWTSTPDDVIRFARAFEKRLETLSLRRERAA